jgi:hypothetical protein
MLRPPRFLSAAILTSALVLPAQGAISPRVAVSADRQTATVGDPIQILVNIQHRADWKLVPDPPLRNLGEFDVLHDSSFVDRWNEGEDGKAFKRQLVLAAFRPGGFWIPSLRGQILTRSGDTLTWQSDSLAITIGSVLSQPGADTINIAGLKGPYVAPVATWYWWALGAIALLLTALLLWLRSRRRAAVTAVVVPSIPAWEAALQQLAKLRQDVQPQQEGGRVWYFRLSEILRRYLDGRYGWNSIDQTSTEIIRQLPEAPFDGSHRERAEEFLRVADQVRYAKQPAREGRPEVDLEWVRTFVNETIPHLVPETSEPVGSAPEAESKP